jgi:hypothetical protein
LWAVIALISLLAVIVIVLSLPVDILFSLNTQRSQWINLNINWCFGLVRINLRKVKGRQTVKCQKHKSPSKFGYDTIVRIIRIRGIFRQVFNLVRNLICSFEIRTLDCELRIGLEDPVDNGYLFAGIIPINHLLNRTSHNINIQAAFENELIFDCNALARIRTFPLVIVGSVLGFLFSRPVFKAIRIMADARWRKRR